MTRRPGPAPALASAARQTSVLPGSGQPARGPAPRTAADLDQEVLENRTARFVLLNGKSLMGKVVAVARYSLLVDVDGHRVFLPKHAILYAVVDPQALSRTRNGH